MDLPPGAHVDNYVLEVLKNAGLDQSLINKFIFQFNVRHFEHFSHVSDRHMTGIGMTTPQIKQLREQIRKMSRELWNRSDPTPVYVAGDELKSTIDERAIIPVEQIKFTETIGEGSFAVVKRGIWDQNGTSRPVAVKILRDISPSVLDDLTVEASHLLKLQHPGLIRLFGIVRQPAMLVFELCECGSLLDRLREDKLHPPPLVSLLLDYCIQIAKALQFLESKHCVHRDIAARNILLTNGENTVKICDFGLMRALKENEQMYTMAPQKKVPFAWCPPEALRHRKFSHASDVWSYGVTMWEMFTFGEEPWVGCRAIDVLKNIDAGETLEKPEKCSNRMYQIMRSCWRVNPEERPKFSAIREDLKTATFLEAKARDEFRSKDARKIQIVKGDDVLVIENKGEVSYGQNKRNHTFGDFPTSIVFTPINHAVAATTTATPQKVPTAPTIRVPPELRFQPPPVLSHNNNNTIAPVNDRTSRISMPVAGSFIHTGHGDPLGGQSWGNPATIDQVYLKNPVKGVPLVSSSNGAELIASKEHLTNGGKNTHINAAPSTSAAPIALSSGLRSLSLDLPEYDDFDRAFDDGFSPSKIELPRGVGIGHTSSNWDTSLDATSSMTSRNGFANTVVIDPPKANNVKFDIRGNVLKPTPVDSIRSLGSTTHVQDSRDATRGPGINVTPHVNFDPQYPRNLPNNLMPELRFRLENDLANSMRPRPASSTGVQSNGVDVRGALSQRPVSVVPTASIVQPPRDIPCLVPTPAPMPTVVKAPVSQQTAMQKALADELKGNLSRRPTNGRPEGSAAHPHPQTTVRAQPALQPQPFQPIHPQEKITPAPVTSVPAPMTSVPRPVSSVKISQPSYPVQSATTTVVPKTVAPTQAPVKKVAPPSTEPAVAPSAPVKSDVVVNRRPSPINMSEEERRSKIILEINSALPAPSSLLFGSSSTSSLPTTGSSGSRQLPTTSSHPQPTMPPKKTSEPILSTEVLQPTRLHNEATTVAQPASKPIQNQAPKNKVTVGPLYPTQSIAPTLNTNNHVPLFNIANSTNVNPYWVSAASAPNYGFGQYPNQFNYYNQGNFGHAPMFPSSAPSLPPLAPSENRFSGTAEPLDESAIRELLGNQTDSFDLGISERMEVLYKEAHFTQPGNCDSMVAKCNGNTELALKLLKEQHLVDMGLVQNIEGARRALQAQQYDLTGAANYLLG